LNVGGTGPWAWDGSRTSLTEQIQQTLVTTMHRDVSEDAAGFLDAAPTNDGGAEVGTADDIAAFLMTLSIPEGPDHQSQPHSDGRAVFQRLRCDRCHDPARNFTTPGVYDVGVQDERGGRHFNPPSLAGLRHRRAFFHDARFRYLDDLLSQHPDPVPALSPEDATALRAFLRSL
jgi:cytochrome c peroxidase